MLITVTFKVADKQLGTDTWTLKYYTYFGSENAVDPESQEIFGVMHRIEELHKPSKVFYKSIIVEDNYEEVEPPEDK